MPRDYSKPPRGGADRPARAPYKPGGARKPFAKREGGFDSGGDRPYRKPFVKREEGGDRPYRKPFGEGRSFDRPKREYGGPKREYGGPKREYGGPKREYGGPRREFGEQKDFRPPRYDDELFTASGKVAEIVGDEAQSKQDMLHKLWDFFRDEELITISGRRVRPNADEWRDDDAERPARRAKSSYEDMPPPRTPRKPAGDHPAAKRAKTLEGVPRRKFKETRGQ